MLDISNLDNNIIQIYTEEGFRWIDWRLTTTFAVFQLYRGMIFFYINLISLLNKGNNKINELRTILQRESQNS
jgi:hypothetical protein